MDDIIMIAQNKKEAIGFYNGAKYYMEQILNLRLNPKSRVFRCGVLLDFVGYRTGEDFRLLRKRSKQKLDKIMADFITGNDDIERFCIRLNSWYGHASHADCYRYISNRLARLTDEIKNGDNAQSS